MSVAVGRRADPALEAALASMAPPGISIACRVIAPNDEDSLLPAEADALRMRSATVRRQSGAARAAARELMKVLGLGEAALPWSETGAPVWPPGLVGSLAHDHDIAVATVALSPPFSALGVDVEPPEPLPPELIDVVATPSERRRYPADLLATRVLFVAKEATYKALNPLNGVFLDFHDIEVDLEAKRAETRQGHYVDLAITLETRLVALAFR